MTPEFDRPAIKSRSAAWNLELRMSISYSCLYDFERGNLGWSALLERALPI